jgi:hypothetical protein
MTTDIGIYAFNRAIIHIVNVPLDACDNIVGSTTLGTLIIPIIGWDRRYNPDINVYELARLHILYPFF